MKETLLKREPVVKLEKYPVEGRQDFKRITHIEQGEISRLMLNQLSEMINYRFNFCIVGL